MARRKKKAARVTRWVILGVLLLTIAAAGAYYASDRIGIRVKPPVEKPKVTVTSVPKPEPSPAALRRSVVIYIPKETKKGTYLDRSAISCSEKGAKIDEALRVLLQAGEQGGKAEGLIPNGTKMLSPIKIKGNIATVNFSREFTDNFSGGSDQEALTVNSIVHTLVTNSDGKVSSVRILVEGNSVETLGGHLELTDPVAADSTLLRPGSLN